MSERLCCQGFLTDELSVALHPGWPPSRSFHLLSFILMSSTGLEVHKQDGTTITRKFQLHFLRNAIHCQRYRWSLEAGINPGQVISSSQYREMKKPVKTQTDKGRHHLN